MEHRDGPIRFDGHSDPSNNPEPVPMAAATKRGRSAKPAAAKTPLAKRLKVFLAELATSSNVTASAKRADIPLATVYETRRRNQEFFRAWQQALCEGYDHLEMELLHRLRTGEIKRATGAKVGVRTFENAVALRQLAAHKESVARQRSIRDNEDVAAIRLSISAKLERMRAASLAAGQDVGAIPEDDAS